MNSASLIPCFFCSFFFFFFSSSSPSASPHSGQGVKERVRERERARVTDGKGRGGSKGMDRCKGRRRCQRYIKGYPRQKGIFRDRRNIHVCTLDRQAGRQAEMIDRETKNCLAHTLICLVCGLCRTVTATTNTTHGEWWGVKEQTCMTNRPEADGQIAVVPQG